jgi:hypothetical protein
MKEIDYYHFFNLNFVASSQEVFSSMVNKKIKGVKLQPASKISAYFCRSIIPWSGDRNVIPGPALATSTSSGFMNLVLQLNAIALDAAYTQDGKIQLVWRIPAGSNTSYFIIERFDVSYNAWVRLGKVQATENLLSPISCSFTVDVAPEQRYEIRLEQVDAGGTFIYSPVKRIEGNANETPILFYNADYRILQLRLNL